MTHEAALRLGIFLGLLAAFALWEALAPRRADPPARTRRWPVNLAFVVLGGLVTRVVLPGGVAAFAASAQANGWGFLAALAIPDWAAFVVSIVALDLAIYFQHRLFHRIPVFWSIHRMHHSDTMFDVSTAVRFHPVEIGLSLAIKVAVVAVIGASPESVLAFEILLNAASLFNHTNGRMPDWIERPLRLIVVTPDMHRIHHSARREETDSNFGFSVSIWDRLFATYRAEPADGQDGLTIGLESYRERESQGLLRLLAQPFGRGQ
ncbi:MAG: sterol desaturase family protein [Alphaproteobacteria bacterium]|nr:sterol desaturase family protein [Alphaproteobacteria bacterium]